MTTNHFVWTSQQDKTLDDLICRSKPCLTNVANLFFHRVLQITNVDCVSYEYFTLQTNLRIIRTWLPESEFRHVLNVSAANNPRLVWHPQLTRTVTPRPTLRTAELFWIPNARLRGCGLFSLSCSLPSPIAPNIIGLPPRPPSTFGTPIDAIPYIWGTQYCIVFICAGS